MESRWPYEPVEENGLGADEIRRLPLACSWPEPDIRSRIAELRETFLPRILRLEQIRDGYVYWLKRTDENMRQVAEFALFESRCCNFLSFGIGLHPEGNEISLRITGPQDGPEFLRDAMKGNVQSSCCS